MTRTRPRSFTFLLAALAFVSSASALAAQDATPLRPGQTLSGSLATGDTARYTLASGDDFFVRGVVDQVSVDVVVRVVGPDGDQIARFDGPGQGAERFQFETESEGDHQLQVIPFEEEEGDYTITLERLEPVATDPEELAEQLLSAYEGTDTPGAAVQVWREGETLYSRAWGMANLAYGIPFETDTRTNIGSTSKQFTAFAVQLLAERGELSLDDPVRKHIPELPAFDDTVRVRHLLTHTSGYREFLNLLVMTGRRLDRGDSIDRDELLMVIQNQPALQNAPGSEWNYNNTAFALAALIVERVSEQTYPDFVATNVFGPLGMDRSVVRPDPQVIVEARSMGYGPAPDGGFLELRDLGAAMGAGGVYTTVQDLQRWVENYREPRVGSRDLVDEMMTSFVTTTGDTTGYGLGLFVDEQRGLRRVHHGGADIAHRSMLAYYPEIGAGITVQSNHAGFDSNVAFRLAEAFFGDAMEPEEGAVAEEEAFDAASFDPEAFDAYTGRYALEANPAVVISLSRDDDRLLTQVTGQPELTLTALSDTVFAVDGVEASFVVHTDEDGQGETLTLRQGGVEQRAERIEAEAWSPDPDELHAFTGRYLSHEIETFYTVVLEAPDEVEGSDEDEADGPGLVLKQRRLDDMNLTPGEKDTFSAPGGFQVAFERDRNGQVIGFYLSNGRTRDVRFERIG